ncbi:hypothetical protein MNB_ARC-1_991 [hydrothermal vent metagenome]|uniref:Uncharacterized protein n=1 Tax=hydrothermal vent metagenome TaxID=652676 RepID=A0A3B1DR46_9ZZZZ
MRKLIEELKSNKYNIKILDQSGIESIFTIKSSKIALFILNHSYNKEIVKEMVKNNIELRLFNLEQDEFESVKKLIYKIK